MLESHTTVSQPASTPGFSWQAVARLIRLHSQTGTLLLLLPTFWSLVLAARGLPPWRLTFVFICGAFLMRSAGVALNDLTDRSFDRQVARTRLRPLASGELSPVQGLAVALTLLALAGLLVLTLNPLTIWLSPVALLLALLYPFAKRFIHVPQAILGIAFGWGTVMAWSASREAVEIEAWLLFAATVCWAIGYDTIYALQDIEDDRKVGVKSSALWFGSSVWLAVGCFLLAMLVLLAMVGVHTAVRWPYFAALGGCGLFALRQTLRLRHPVDAVEAFHMFRKHVGMGAAILGGLLVGFS